MRDFPGGPVLKNPPAVHEIWVWSLGQEDPSEKEAAIHSSILAWEILIVKNIAWYTQIFIILFKILKYILYFFKIFILFLNFT